MKTIRKTFKALAYILTISMFLTCIPSFSVFGAEEPMAARSSNDLSMVANSSINILSNYVYTFTSPETATIESVGWRVVPGQTVKYRGQEYGTQIMSNAVNDQLIYELNVPDDGIYTVKVNGGGASGGAIAGLFVDGFEAGQYDFYLAQYQQSKGQVSMKTFILTKGIHQLAFKAVGHTAGSWGYNMYPGELALTKLESFPALETLNLISGEVEMAVGQATSTTVTGILSDGFSYNIMNIALASTQLVSSDDAVASIDQNGLITANATGAVDIKATVTLGGVTLEDTITIKVNDKKLGNITITSDKSELVVGQMTSTVIQAVFDDETVADISSAVKHFSTTTPELVSVSGAGVVSALSGGTANVHVDVTLGSVTKSTDLTFKIIERALYTVKITASKTILLKDESTQLTIIGTMNDGTDADLASAVIAYVSDAPGVASVNNGTVTAVAGGDAVIKAIVILGGVTLESTISISVGHGVATYDFTKPVNSTMDQVGWQVAEHNIPGSTPYRNQVYGIQIQSNAVGQYFKIDFKVQKAGDYTIGLNGGGAGSGGLASILIDGEEVGEYDFYLAEYKQEKGLVTMKTIELTEGIHQITFIVKAKKEYYNMYPGKLMLIERTKLYNLESMSLAAVNTELMEGQTTQITMRGAMSDGLSYNLSKISSIEKTYTSSNETVASIDANGRLTALKPGIVTITGKAVLYGVTKENTIVILVNDKVLGNVTLTLDRSNLVVTGDNGKLSVKGALDNGTTVDLSNAAISFTTSTQSNISISTNGLVTPLRAGMATAYVEVTLGPVTRSADLQIQVVDPDLKTFVLGMYKSSVFIGDILEPKPAGTLNTEKTADMSKANIIYESSDSAVVSINNGLLKAIGAGMTTIKAIATIGQTTMTAETQVTVREVSSSKTRSTYYTQGKIASARQNIASYEWARITRDEAVAKAEQYLALGFDKLWRSVTPQTIPRSYAVNQELGSPITGKEINKFGNYPWIVDPKQPWKLKDPSSGYVFPTNDFRAYYDSGLDEHGIFNPDLADKSLLKNTLYPEKGEKWGVDDGYGWIDENGNKWTFIAYYNHWHVWEYAGFVYDALSSLKDTYIYTGDIKYAQAGIVLLDRIADVYPEMDTSKYPKEQGYLNSDGGEGRGKIVGCIWETDLARQFVRAYDAFYPVIDDAKVIQYLSSQASEYKLGVLKNSANGIKRNIEDGIVRQIYPSIRNGFIRGNTGMHQSALALAAVVLDTLPETKEWLDFDFQAGGYDNSTKQISGGNILAALVNDIDRDGNGNEASPEYNSIWLSQFLTVADILEGYDLYPSADLYNNSKFRKMFSALYPLMMSDIYGALIGDTGTTGGPVNYLDKEQMIKAFIKFGDPIFAQLAYYLNNNKTDGIHGDIFTSDTGKVAADIEEVVAAHGKLKLDSTNLTGYGFAVLRDGENHKSYFGINLDFAKMKVIDTNTSYKLFENSGTIQLETSSDESALGKYITFELNVPKTDTYEIDLQPYKAASYGTYSVSIDGNFIKNVDFFGTSGATSKLEKLVTMELTQGIHEITFKCVGRNTAGSGNYKMGVIQLLLFDQEAVAIKDSSEAVNSLRDLWIYYGRNGGHGHSDTLNLGIHAFGLDLAPELGYPETADGAAHRHEWVNNTISHNTVLVDKTRQNTQLVGMPLHFDDSDFVKLVDVEAPNVYRQTEQYRRTSAMIKVDKYNTYTVDFFRVKGGTDHNFSFHGANGPVTVEGLQMIPQTDANGQYVGTYAGADIPFGNSSTNAAGYTGSGFHWLKNVDRDENPSSIFSVDWDVNNTIGSDEDIHLRLTMLGNIDDVALADGIPPQNNATNPKSLRYLVAHRSGQNLDSNFVSVIEPYSDSRYIDSIIAAELKVNGAVTDSSEAKAVKITLKNGRIDYIVYSQDPTIEYTVDDKFQFMGFFGVYSEVEGKQVYGYLNEGTVIGKTASARSSLSGTVIDFTREMSTSNRITVRLNENGVSTEDLVGRYIYAQNDSVRNASYLIKGVKALDDGSLELDIGGITLIRSYVDSSDFSKGYIYDLAANAKYTIPLSTEKVIQLSEVNLSADKAELTRMQKAALTLAGKLSTGEDADLSGAAIEFVSSNPAVAKVENGVVIACNTGSADIYAKVTLNGVTVQSNLVTVKVVVSINSISKLIDKYQKSGDLKKPLANVLKAELKIVQLMYEKGAKKLAIKQMQNFVKSVNLAAKYSQISAKAKEVLNSDANALINLWNQK